MSYPNVIDSLLKRNYSFVLFLLTIAGNFVGDIYSCDMRKIYHDNMVLKHLTSIFMFYVFIVNIENSNSSPIENIYICLIMYLLFILIMRSHVITQIMTLSLIFTNYFIENIKSYYYKKEDKQYKLFSKIQKYLTTICVIILLLSICYRIYKLKIILGDKFKLSKYLIGMTDEECFSSNLKIKGFLGY